MPEEFIIPFKDLLPSNDEEDFSIMEISKGTEYLVNLDKNVDIPEVYRELCHVFRTATEKDTIRLIVANYGGVLDTAIQLGQEMLRCKAHIIADIHVAASAATIISLYADEIIVHPFTVFMLHTFSGHNVGKGQELRAKADFDERYFANLCRLIYAGIMSEEEMTQMLDGKDFWLDGLELQERLKSWTPIKKRT